MVLKQIIKPALAQNPFPLGELRGIGAIGLQPVGSNPMDTITRIASVLVGFLTICAGLWFTIKIILAGYNFMNASGDAGKIEAARKQITDNVIGMLIVVAAIFLTSLIGRILDIEYLRIPHQIINNLRI